MHFSNKSAGLQSGAEHTRFQIAEQVVLQDELSDAMGSLAVALVARRLKRGMHLL